MGLFFEDELSLHSKIQLAGLRIKELYYKIGGYDFEEAVNSFGSKLIIEELRSKYEFTEPEIEALLRWIKEKDLATLPTIGHSIDLSPVTIYELEDFINADLGNDQEDR